MLSSKRRYSYHRFMSAEIKVQSLLSHTTYRIVKLQEKVIDANVENIDSNVLTFVYKWDIDGTSNQSIYKQNWPIWLFAYSSMKNDNIIFWQNPQPACKY